MSAFQEPKDQSQTNVQHLSAEEVRLLNQEASAARILQVVNSRFGVRAVVASSFGVEDVVLVDLCLHHAPQVRFMTLDTGRLHPETYELMEVYRKRYGLTIEVFSPQAGPVESLQRENGFFSFRNSVEARRSCCAIRKVEPLGRALSGREAWVTGLRRHQGVTRANTESVEFDTVHGLWKFNPLSRWTTSELWAHVHSRKLPYHRLYESGYASIGCAPCTRSIKPHEDERAGRWWWESESHKECGLHA